MNGDRRTTRVVVVDPSVASRLVPAVAGRRHASIDRALGAIGRRLLFTTIVSHALSGFAALPAVRTLDRLIRAASTSITSGCASDGDESARRHGPSPS
jgi:hypothetical protein